MHNFFQTLRNKSSKPVLRLPDITKPFTIMRDASKTAVAWVILQERVDYNGKIWMHPIAYGSKTFTPQQVKSWDIRKKELAAVVFATTAHKDILAFKDVTAYTDHRNLEFLMKHHHEDNLFQKWKIFLKARGVTLRYMKGRYMNIPDALSRCSQITTKDQGTIQQDISKLELPPRRQGYKRLMLMGLVRKSSETMVMEKTPTVERIVEKTPSLFNICNDMMIQRLNSPINMNCTPTQGESSEDSKEVESCHNFLYAKELSNKTCYMNLSKIPEEEIN